MMMIWMIIKYFVWFSNAYMIIAAIAAVFQERKIWQHPNIPSLSIFGHIKVFLCNYTWMLLCGIGAIVTVLYSIITLGGNPKIRRHIAHNLVERNVGKVALGLFVGPVIVHGEENLPGEEEPTSTLPAPIYIANHVSQIDPGAVCFLNRSWRWTAKSSVLLLPGVGQCMYLSDHIFIDRLKKKKKKQQQPDSNNKNNSTTNDDSKTTRTTSEQDDGDDDTKKKDKEPMKTQTQTQTKTTTSSFTGTRNLYIKSNMSVREGVPMFFFPQGTRRLGDRLPFKDGAFRVGKENNCMLIPISIHVPLSAWNSLYPFVPTKDVEPIVLTVHKPIPCNNGNNDGDDDDDIETLKQKCFDVIYSVLPDYSKQS